MLSDMYIKRKKPTTFAWRRQTPKQAQRIKDIKNKL
jgi:hypothetical protein